jgi:peptidoglycan/LPS O-acetylase OafA/YrhL
MKTLTWWSPERALIWDLLLQFVLVSSAIVVVGALLFYFVEKPFMRIRQRRRLSAPLR